MLREPVRRDRIVTILPSGKVGRELVKKRAPPGEANCVVVRHTASDGSKGLHLRAIATMAPGTQLTITFEEPTEAKADAMDVDDDRGAAPMLVEPRPAEDHLQPMSDELDGDDAPSTEDGVLLLPRGLFDALDDHDDEAPVAPSDPADFFPSRRRAASVGEDSSDDESVDSLLDSDSDSDAEADWSLDARLLREQQDMEPPAELAGGLKAVDLDAMFGYAVRPNPRVTEEERWNEDDAEPVVVAPAATTVIEAPEEIDAEAEAEFIEASVPEATDDSDDDSDDDFAVEESDEDDDAAEPMDVDAGAPALAPPAPAATLEPAVTAAPREPAAPEAALVPAAPARAPLQFDPTCRQCCNERDGLGKIPDAQGSRAHTCARGQAARAARDLAARAAERKAPAAQTEALAIFLAAEPTDGAAPAAPKKPLALKPLLTPKSKRVATKAMPKFKAKADAAEHDTVDWKVGARQAKNDGRDAVYFSPGGRVYKSVPAALIRMDEGPKLPTRSEQIKAAGGIKARLALCLSRATLLAPDEVAYRRPTPSTRLTPSSRLATLFTQASAIQLLRDRFAAYPEVRSFLAAYDEPHRTVQDKVAALLTPTRHHVISRAQHARVNASSKVGGLAALGFGVLKARDHRNVLITDDEGHQVYTFSITSENAGTDKSHKKNNTYASPQAARPRSPHPSTVRDRTSFPRRPPRPTTSSRGARRCPSTRRRRCSRPAGRSSRRRSSTARTCTTTSRRYTASTVARSRSAVSTPTCRPSPPPSSPPRS